MSTIVIVDNERDEIMHLGQIIEAAFPESTVVPPAADRERKLSIFTDWDRVLTYLLNIDDRDVTACLDLSLAKVWTFVDVAMGLQMVARIREARPHWTLIAFTKALAYARRTNEHFDALFDGSIDKATLASKVNADETQFYVRNAIDGARRRREKGTDGDELSPAAIAVDSFGMRLFRAALPDGTLREILQRETVGWGPVRIESLSSGYSGAYMLKLTETSGVGSVILKVARSEEIVASEVQATTKYLSQLEPFGARFALVDGTLRRLDSGGVYYRQQPVRGRTIIDLCQCGGASPIKEIELVIRMCIRVLDAVPVSSRPKESARRCFPLTSIDKGRLQTSAAFVTELGKAMVTAGVWPASLPTADQISHDVLAMVDGWEAADIAEVMLPQAVQHGDLNPGNVIVADDVPTLIDLQRLGPWPIGYDIARLSGLLRVRVTDAYERADWMPFLFGRWCKATVEADGKDGVTNKMCPEAEYGEAEFLRYVSRIPEEAGGLVKYGFYLGVLWDLVKICSYQDLSPFKRAWALVAVWSMRQRLNRWLKNI